jgi:hypothetical protein
MYSNQTNVGNVNYILHYVEAMDETLYCCTLYSNSYLIVLPTGIYVGIII